MRIVFISDTHFQHELMDWDIPEGDVLVHCGDALNHGTVVETQVFSRWFNQFPHPHKIYVPGNHDKFFQENLVLSREIMENEDYSYCRVLVDAKVFIEGVTFYGSPWTKTFNDWSYMKEEKDLKYVWDEIYQGTDVLITHGPPQSILDMNDEGYRCGSKSLKNRIFEFRPAVHAFGHIHESYGRVDMTHTTFINASICTRNYLPTNKPVIYDLDG